MVRKTIPAFLKEGWFFYFQFIKTLEIMKHIPKTVEKDHIANGFAKFQWTFIKLSVLSIVFTFLIASPLFLDKAFSQSNIKIEGYVYDLESGHPVPGAEAIIRNSSYRTATNNSGFFFFDKLPTGSYSLEVYSSGYVKEIVPDVEVTEDITTRVNVHLKRVVFVLPPIEVTAERTPISSASVEFINRERIRDLQVNTVAEVLETFEGVFVQKTGTMAGRHEVTIRGSSPKDVLVLIDGQRINPSASGRVDLNSIPLEMVEKIEVY